jgi:hypothetical protein
MITFPIETTGSSSAMKLSDAAAGDSRSSWRILSRLSDFEPSLYEWVA